MVGRENLLKVIHLKMMLNKELFLNIYGYEISFPGFADESIKVLNDAGCSRAREYYDKVILEYKKKHDEEIKKVSVWHRKECKKEWQEKRGEVKRKQEQENLQQMSDSHLIMLLENLISVT